MSDICICGSVMCGVCVICYICSRQGAFWQTQTNCLLHPTKMNMPPLPVNPTKPKTTELATGCNPGATGQQGAIQGHCPPPHTLPLAPPFWYSQATQGRSPAKRISAWPWRLCGIAAILLQKGGEGRGATSLIHDRRCLADRESASSVEGCRHAGLLQVQGSPPRPELLQGHRQFATINVEGKVYVMLLLLRLQQDMEGRLHGCPAWLQPQQRYGGLPLQHASAGGSGSVTCNPPSCRLRGKDLYSGSRARVTAHGIESDWFNIRTGVRQGCPLSPLPLPLQLLKVPTL